MAENFTIRLDKSLMNKIDGYAQSKEMSRTEGMRSLINSGLKVNDIKEDDSQDIEFEFKKILLEIYLTNSQLFLSENKNIDHKQLSKNSELLKCRIKKKYPLIEDKFADFLHHNKTLGLESNSE